MLKPIKNNILIKLAPRTNQTASGIILSREKREQWAEIVDLGSSVDTKTFKIGQRIMVELGKFKLVDVNDGEPNREYAIVDQDYIIGIFEE